MKNGQKSDVIKCKIDVIGCIFHVKYKNIVLIYNVILILKISAAF